jgi:hypothetical protein
METVMPEKRTDGGNGLRGKNQEEGDLQDQKDAVRELPEGLKRERKGPLDRNSGRRREG